MHPVILIFAGIGLIAAGYDSLSEKLTKPKNASKPVIDVKPELQPEKQPVQEIVKNDSKENSTVNSA